MDALPHDSVCVILSFVSLEQQLQASACCKKWRSVVTPPPYGILHAPQTLLAVSYDFDKLKPFYEFHFYTGTYTQFIFLFLQTIVPCLPTFNSKHRISTTLPNCTCQKINNNHPSLLQLPLVTITITLLPYQPPLPLPPLWMPLHLPTPMSLHAPSLPSLTCSWHNYKKPPCPSIP